MPASTTVFDSVALTLAICQDDDYWLPTNLEKPVHAMRSPRVGVSHGAFDLIDREGRVSALFRRSALYETPIRIDDGVLCDTGLWLRLAQPWDVAFVGQTLSALRVHPGAVSVVEGLNDQFRQTTMYEIDLAQRVKNNFLSGYQGDAGESRELWSLVQKWRSTSCQRGCTDHFPGEISDRHTEKPWEAEAGRARLRRRLARSYRILLASLAGSRGRNTKRRLLGLPPIPTRPS